MDNQKIVLMILDGFGLNDRIEGNGIKKAKTPVIDGLMKDYPFVKGNASGLSVGLPEGQMGNSEVGHLNIGAGRIIYQELTRISKEIQDGSFYENTRLLDAIENSQKNNSDLHLIGLLSDGGVHSFNKHLYGLIELANKKGIKNVYIHAFMDGRDTAPTSGIEYIKDLQKVIEKFDTGKIATISGRYFAMDRDQRWDRVEKAYRAMVYGDGIIETNPASAVEKSYKNDVTDEFISPVVIFENNKPVANIKDGDSVIFFNFRPDRAREITRAFCDDEFKGFNRPDRIKTHFVCFTEYDININNKTVAFDKVEIKNTFGEFIAEKGMKQARIAETEKYAHVTFFFNGGVEKPNKGEDRILVNSPKVSTYDLMPEMSAEPVCDELISAIRKNIYDVIIINFANPDMVGHTGIEKAVIKAVETVDKCVGKAVEAAVQNNYTMFLCADHGNAEQLIDYNTKEIFTAHTTNPVPFILINSRKDYSLKENGCLADIAPTLIDLMGMEKPEEMTGKSLLIKNSK